ncbi:MAG: cysteine dioxygenase family protein [Syntrophaceae bacterium]|nr:cysteine dioxygenase family protein [Syntrophaceae bacterium]
MNLDEFCKGFRALSVERPDVPRSYEAGKKLLGELLRDPAWFGDFLQRYISGPAFLTEEPASVFDNEIRIHRSPDKSFTLLAYIWDKPDLCPVHDHSAWGLIGPLLNPLREVKYRRTDDGNAEGFAELERVSEFLLKPGEVGFVLPLDKGIHQTGAAKDGITISLGVYGRSIRKGYIHFFKPEEKKITRARMRIPFRRVLALRALASVGEAVGKTLLTSSLLDPLPKDWVREFRASS